MSKHVLVVDNDRFCVEVLADFLAESGHTVSRAFDGMEAIEALQRQRPDVVLLDMVMPKIDGDQVLRYIRENPETCDIRVVIVSGTLVEENRERLLAMGADGYVAKGRLEDLRRNVQAVLERLDRDGARARREVLGLEKLVPREKVRELLATRRYKAAILRTIGEGVVEVDEQGRILAINRAGVEILGQSEGQLIGKPLTTLLGDAHRTTLENILARSMADTGAADTATVRYRDRTLRINLARVAPEDPASGLFLILHDITDLAEKIEELSTLNARLQAMDGMRSELLTMVSHDLHTPLTAIKGSLEVLLHEGVGVELGRELLGIAQQNADRLFRMVSDILDLARIEAGRFSRPREPFDVVVSLRGTIDRLQRMGADKGITFSLTAPQQVPLVLADGFRMEQVFTNLMGNALKFTPRGGQIRVVVEELEGDILVEVQDTGVGIPAEHLERIFDRFYRVPLPAGAAVDGTGLGLTICKAVVEDHGGRIWVESKVGQGTTFFVTIPKQAPAPTRS